MDGQYLVLATATVKEMKSLLRDHIQEIPNLSVGQPIEICFNNRCFILLITGIGPVNAAFEMGKLIGGKSLQGVLNYGIAGSFDLEEYPLLTTAIINEEIWPEYGLLSENGVDARGLKYAQGCLEDKEIWDRIRLDPVEQSGKLDIFLPPAWKQGKSLTVAGASGTLEMAGNRYRLYQADFENMEGFALAWACFREKIPFIEIRTISNRVGSRNRKDWDISGALKSLNQAWKTMFEFF